MVELVDTSDLGSGGLCCGGSSPFARTKNRIGVFYENCKVAGNNSRILIVELCRRLMKTTFDVLGLTPIEKI